MLTIYLIREKVRNPVIKEILDAGRNLKGEGSISVGYGSRIIISTRNHIKSLGEEDFIEVVDYNPSTDTALVIGLKEPPPTLPLHWFLHRMPGVNAVLHIWKDLDTRFSMEDIFDILERIKEKGYLLDERIGMIYTGESLKEILNLVTSIQ